MKIYLLRHGQVQSNLQHCFDFPNEPLTELGVEQSKIARDKLKNEHFDIIYCSPLKRAKQTAEIINVNGYKIIYDQRLAERSDGNLSGKPLDSIDREEYHNYFSKIQFGTAENYQLFFKRVFNFLDELKTKEYSSVLIVAHNGIVKAFSAYFEGFGDGKFLRRGIDNCEVKIYEL